MFVFAQQIAWNVVACIMALTMPILWRDVVGHLNIGESVNFMIMTVVVTLVGCDGTLRDDAACEAASDRQSQQGRHCKDENDLQSLDHRNSHVRSGLTNALCRNWVTPKIT